MTTAVGLLLSFKFPFPELATSPFFSFGRLRAIHTNGTFYGWASVALTGASLYVAARTSVGSKNVAGFDYSALGVQVYASNCMSCHGAQGAGTPNVFPPLAGDAVVNAKDATNHIRVVLKGLAGKSSTACHMELKCRRLRRN